MHSIGHSSTCQHTHTRTHTWKSCSPCIMIILCSRSTCTKIGKGADFYVHRLIGSRCFIVLGEQNEDISWKPALNRLEEFVAVQDFQRDFLEKISSCDCQSKRKRMSSGDSPIRQESLSTHTPHMQKEDRKEIFLSVFTEKVSLNLL